MYVVAVTVHVKPDFIEPFIEATLENARNTRREPANLRFDLNRALDDPGRFFLYEVYENEDGFKAHQQTEHYFKWRETVADWMAQQRQGLKHASIFPESPAAWRAEG